MVPLYLCETKLMRFLTDQGRIPGPGNWLLFQLLESELFNTKAVPVWSAGIFQTWPCCWSCPAAGAVPLAAWILRHRHSAGFGGLWLFKEMAPVVCRLQVLIGPFVRCLVSARSARWKVVHTFR